VRRAIVVAALAALGAAAPAAAASGGAGVPPTHGTSAIGKNLPLKVFASVNAPVQLFGNAITTQVAVVADRKWVDPANVRVAVNFSPYQPVGAPAETHTGSGRTVQVTWTWTLLCLTVQCVPEMAKSDISRIFHFHAAHVEYLSSAGQVRYSLSARFQPVVVYSELSPTVVNALTAHQIDWAAPATPIPTPHYRVSPDLLFGLAVTLAVLVGVAGAAIAARWALQFRPHAASLPTLPTSSLERALTLFFWARARDDETLQRKALERVADELPFDVHDLSETARALAWSPEAPDEEGVHEISERAGVHPSNGEGGL
jgi:hypothetical protein